MSYKAFVIKLMELVEHLEKAQNLSKIGKRPRSGRSIIGLKRL